jgi:hypothetical protein
MAAIYGFGVLLFYLQATVFPEPIVPNFFGPLVQTLNDGSVAQIVLVLFFLLPIVTIVGGGIALQFLWPGVLLTLVAAAGWVFVGLLLNLGLTVNQLNVVPLFLCALAAVLAFLGGFESERVASWIAGIVALLTAGLLGFIIFDYYRGPDSMFFAGNSSVIPTVEVPVAVEEPEPPTDDPEPEPETGLRVPAVDQPLRPATGGTAPN